MIGIVDYGMGNLASVKNAFDYLKVATTFVSDAAELERADKIVLPGVGAFGMAMDNLRRRGFVDAIRELVLVNERPIIGLCLGMQLLLDRSSEHGDHEGLKIVPGDVRFFGDAVTDLSVPHMGWNDAEHPAGSAVFTRAETAPTYYFVHSYYCRLANADDVAGVTQYGIEFHSCLERGHVFGCQFHPEKSQRNGLAILKRFSAL